MLHIVLCMYIIHDPANDEAGSPAMVRRICLIKMVTNFLLCLSWQDLIEIFETHTPILLISKIPFFR